MLRTFSAICIVLLAVTFVGCGLAGRPIVAKQIWSENYAMAKGVEATSPLMVDGDSSTFSETQIPTDTTAGSTKLTEAVVKLPEPKSIRKIVVNSINLQSFIVYEGGQTPDDWKTLAEIKNTDETKVTMSVSANTDRIKIRVLRTSDDATIPGGRGGQSRLKHAPGKIKEIEIYGLVREATAPTAQPAGTTAAVSGSTSTSAASGSTGTATSSATKTTTTVSTPVEVPKGPPVTAMLEMAQKTYPIAGPIPLKINIKTGADEQIVLDEIVSSKVLSTKLIVKSSSGEVIASSKPTPSLSSPMPRRFVDKAVDVREANTLDPGSVLTVDIPNLLDYYPIKAPGTYTIQLSTWLELHTKFVGREQTEKDDLEGQIRDINSKSNFTPTEKASLIQNLRDDMKQSQKRKSKRYIETNARGTQFKLESDTIELTIQ
jgi:hypothetical protein